MGVMAEPVDLKFLLNDSFEVLRQISARFERHFTLRYRKSPRRH
jgi:hypothetical protein